jgi:hypothetical protein
LDRCHADRSARNGSVIFWRTYSDLRKRTPEPDFGDRSIAILSRLTLYELPSALELLVSAVLGGVMVKTASGSCPADSGCVQPFWGGTQRPPRIRPAVMLTASAKT